MQRRMLARFGVASAATAAAIGTGILVTTPAAAGPPGEPPPDEATATISQLEAQGYRVIVSKVGHANLEGCQIKSVTFRSPVTDVDAGRDTRNRPTTVATDGYKVAYVTLNC